MGFLATIFHKVLEVYWDLTDDPAETYQEDLNVEVQLLEDLVQAAEDLKFQKRI